MRTALTWPDTPDEAILKSVRDGDARLALARVDGIVQAMGMWRRNPAPVFAHSAELGKIIAHPEARGLGLGARLPAAPAGLPPGGEPTST